MTTLTDERVFSDTLLGPTFGQPIVKSKQGLVFLSRLIGISSGGPLGVNDHLVFVPQLQVGTNAVVDTTSPYTTALNTPSVGRITLQPGVYFVKASALEIGTTAPDGVIEIALRNADTGIYFNPVGFFFAGTDRAFLHDASYITVTGSPMRIEFSVVYAFGLSGSAKGYIEIEQIE